MKFADWLGYVLATPIRKLRLHRRKRMVERQLAQINRYGESVGWYGCALLTRADVEKLIYGNNEVFKHE